MVEQAAYRQAMEEGFRVGAFLAEPPLQRLTKDGEELRLEPKVMEVLVRMAQSPGRTVTKQQFMEEVWEGAVVTDDALLRCISELRRAFDDDPRAPQYIETIRKKGYRLVAPVAPLGAEPAEASPPPAPQPAPQAVPIPAASVPAALVPAVEAPPGRRRWRWGAAVVVVLAGLAAFAVLRRPWEAGPPAPWKAVPLTSYPGVESDPNLSPDGGRVAFVWDQGEGYGFDIYLKQVGVETALRLTRTPADDASPAWSPDGQHLAFIRSGADGNGVYVIPAVGGSERRVLDLGTREARNVVWSPQGDLLALTVQGTSSSSFGISLFSLADLAERTLTEPSPDYLGDLELAFSPDGSRLVFTRSVVERVDDLYVVDMRGGELKRLTFEHAEITGVDWSPDGRTILFSSNREGTPALWRIPASGGAPAWVPTAGEGSGLQQPSLARQGRRMTFVQRAQETNIWGLRLDVEEDGEEEPVPERLVASTRWDSHPALSPDGARIAFASNRSGGFEIWVSEADGSAPYQATRFEGPFTNTPRWSPDGRRVAFVARNEGSVDVYTVESAGGQSRRMTTAASNDTAPSWSHDGAWLYFASNRSGNWEVWKVSVENGTRLQVTDGGGYAAFEDARGRYLYYTKRGEPGIWRRPVAGGVEEVVVETLQPYDWGNWSVGTDALYHVERTAEGPVLAARSLETGDARVLASLPSLPRHPALAVSPDGRFVLFTRVERQEGDILLIDGYR